MKRERFLLDTNTVLYALFDPQELDRVSSAIFARHVDDFFVSTASVREIIHLHKRGRIKPRVKLTAEILAMCEKMGFKWLPVNREHLRAYAEMTVAPHHNDPNDHIIIAQAIVEQMTLISSDNQFDFYTRQKLRLLFNRRG
ncbi:MAG: type II toxin-antitoxin system VapC family toxin [Planctomycetota bacterium]|jgi:PIN domain nuclease of toxin-antitoxin system|nr:type II toxin-antitoxin system VapC family toxin [Planctomycetota bacterium]